MTILFSKISATYDAEPIKSYTDTNVCHSRESGNDNYLLSNLEN